MTAGSLVRPSKSSKPAVRRLLRTPSYEEALARLQFLVEHGSRLGLVTGGSGVGKTTVLESFAEELRRASCLTAVVNAVGLEPEELLWSIAVKLKAHVESDWNLFQLWRALNDRFTELRFLREQAVVLIDDAALASSDVLVHLRRLLQSDSAAQARLSVVVSATAEGAARLGRGLLDLVDLKIDLPAWSSAETRALVEATGETLRPIRFSAAAIDRLHELAGGAPRSILRLAELARLAAQADGDDFVDSEIVEGVYSELSVQSRAG